MSLIVGQYILELTYRDTSIHINNFILTDLKRQ